MSDTGFDETSEGPSLTRREFAVEGLGYIRVRGCGTASDHINAIWRYMVGLNPPLLSSLQPKPNHPRI